MECLDENTLIWFLRGELSEPQIGGVEAHLDDCASCRDLFGLIAGSSLLSPGSRAQGPLAPEALAQGDTVGRYTIVGVVGSGAMGVVYAANDPRLERKIALKVLHREVGVGSAVEDSKDLAEEGRDRLLAEARTLAQLSHPNLVAVHDVGLHDGRVFVALELVDGVSLATWCEARRSWRDVLDVFRQAGAGLAAAHAAGIIHRDFKPNNVLVSPDGRVRVVDFGLARRIAIPSPHGARREVAGTPAYMAPEQLAGESADARADQFSFCVALYEALYGERPFAGLATASAELRDPASGARVPRWVRAAVVRGLALRRDDRHRDLSALLAQLAPRRPRRVALAIAISLPVAAAIGVGVGSGIGRGDETQAAPCAAAGRLPDGTWDDARRHAMQARFETSGVSYAKDSWRRVDASLTSYTAAWSAMRTEVCVASRVQGEHSPDVADRRTRCLDDRWRAFRSFTELLASADPTVIEHALEAAHGLPSIDRCADVRWLSDDPPSVAMRASVEAIERGLANVVALGSLGRFDDARDALRRLLDEARTVGYAPTLAKVLLSSGLYASQDRDFPAARRALREAVLAAEAGHADATRATAWLNLANVADRAGQPSEGFSALEQAEAIVQRIGGDVAVEAELAYTRGALELAMGRLAEAREATARSLTLSVQAFGATSTRVAPPLQLLGMIATAEGKADDALSITQRMLAVVAQEVGDMHPHYADALEGLGGAQWTAGQLDHALATYERSLAIREQAFGSSDPRVALSLSNLAGVHEAQERWDRALPLLDRAKQITEATLGRAHPRMAHVLVGLAAAHRRLGQGEQARSEALEAVEILQASVGRDHPDTARALDEVGAALTALGRPVEAIPMHREAVATLERALGADHPDLAEVLVQLGQAELAAGRAVEAIPVLERGLTLMEAGGTPIGELATTRLALSRALLAAGRDPARARRLADAARAGVRPPDKNN